MRWNRSGTHFAGGHATLHVDGAVVPALRGVAAGNPEDCWLSDDTIVGQAEVGTSGDRWRVVRLTAPFTTYDVGAPQGANEIRAGGGVWAAWRQGVGYFDSHGRVEPLWAPLAVDDESGDVALVTDRANGRGLVVWNGRTLTPVPGVGVVGREACYRGGVLTFRDGVALKQRHADGTVVTIPVPAGYAGARATVDGWLLLGHGDALYLVHRDAPTQGVLVSTSGRDFLPDLVSERGVVRVVAGDAGQTAGGVHHYVLEPGTRPLVPLGPGAPPPEPAPSSIVLPTPTSCRRHACALDGWEAATGRSHFLPGTVGWSAPRYDARPAYEGMPWARDKVGLWRLVIGTERDVPDGYRDKKAHLQATIAEAKRRSPKARIVVYEDDAAHAAEAAKLRASVQADGLGVDYGLNAYPKSSESAAVAAARLETAVRAIRDAQARAVLVSAGYAVAPAVTALAPLLHRLIETTFPATIDGHLVFGAKRANALPDVVDFWARTWERMEH